MDIIPNAHLCLVALTCSFGATLIVIGILRLAGIADRHDESGN